ncbi:hypothetical protein Bca101_063810 [Brassica carinata]
MEHQSSLIMGEYFVKTSVGAQSTLDFLKRVKCEDLTSFIISLRSQVIYQIGCKPNAKHTSHLQVLCQMIKEHTFSVLRIQEYLGYSVSSHPLCLGGVDHFVIQVTSSEKDCTFLTERILEYADSLNGYLMNKLALWAMTTEVTGLNRASVYGIQQFTKEVNDFVKVSYKNLKDHLSGMEERNHILDF